LQYGFHIDDYIHEGSSMSDQPVYDRATHGVLSLPAVNDGEG